MSKILAGEQYNILFPLKHSKQTFKMFKKNFQLNIKSIKQNGELMEFEMLNTPVIFHNTIRRLIINEVPSVALGKIYFYNNTSIIEDSDLQLRLALVPLDVDPDSLKEHLGGLPSSDENVDEFNEESNLLFELIIKHQKKGYMFSDEINKIAGAAALKFIKEFDKRLDMSVYSDDIKWIPIGNQANKFSNVKAVSGILLDRLLPGEELHIKAVAIKGYGHDHAKFMPMMCAYGRMAHKLELKAEIKGEDAKILQSLFPKGVIEIKNKKAVVGNSLLIKRAHKNYNEIENLKGKVEISFDENHYMWKIGSVRPRNQPPNKILISAFNAMIEKCTFYIENLEQLEAAPKDDRTGLVNAESLAKDMFGKRCYIDIVRPKANPDYPMFHFIGETATLGASLTYMIIHKFGESIMSAYSDLPNGIEVTLEILGTKKNSEANSIEILKASLMELSDYFSYMKEVFLKKYSFFASTDVEME